MTGARRKGRNAEACGACTSQRLNAHWAERISKKSRRPTQNRPMKRLAESRWQLWMDESMRLGAFSGAGAMFLNGHDNRIRGRSDAYRTACSYRAESVAMEMGLDAAYGPAGRFSESGGHCASMFSHRVVERNELVNKVRVHENEFTHAYGAWITDAVTGALK
ncbi:unnamed protein product [Trypanosoma congolense IL3000]|uniref:WGS project CAEQ00000000 data, annotated contig 1665 n=1 Tax=Trypanosoma congolense (strain IL3000) TaxID=1068625 RepID=F9W7W6_TRYCI|nr:unnamed protein product [Trypanosoma congolense IL3000]